MSRTRMIKRNPALHHLSPNARLLRYELITIADDEGRAEYDIPKLAQQLYPADGDAPTCLSTWMDELAREEIIERYWVDGVLYLRLEHWHEEQYISHPTSSTLPASPRERLRVAEEIPESTGEIPEKSAKSRKDKDKSGEPRKILDIFSASDGAEVSPEAARRAAKANLNHGLQRAWEEGDLPTFARLMHLTLRSTDAMGSQRRVAPAPLSADGGVASAATDSSGEAIVYDEKMPTNGMPVKPGDAP